MKSAFLSLDNLTQPWFFTICPKLQSHRPLSNALQSLIASHCVPLLIYCPNMDISRLLSHPNPSRYDQEASIHKFARKCNADWKISLDRVPSTSTATFGRHAYPASSSKPFSDPNPAEQMLDDSISEDSRAVSVHS